VDLPADPNHVLAALDLDLDGDPDLAVPGAGSLCLILNLGDGSFDWPVSLELSPGGSGASGDPPPAPGVLSIAVEDFDADGRPDLVLPFFETGVVRIALDRTVKRSRDADRNGVLDECETELGPLFRRGDTNGDSQLDISDAVASLRHLFVTGEALPCADAADATDDGVLDVSDAVRVLRYLYLGGDPPAGPLALCGRDATADALGCGGFPPCGV
jgi:hypothetical protein